MHIYRQFLRRLSYNYFIGSLVAVFLIGGTFMFSSLTISGLEIVWLGVVLVFSSMVMLLAESRAFRRHLAPIREVLMEESPGIEQLRKGYEQVQRFPVLAVKRIFGPHLLGMSVPATFMTAFFIWQEAIQLQYYMLLLALIGALLVACMHAMIEFFLTIECIRPVLLHLRDKALSLYETELSLEGRILVSLRRKFQLSAFLMGTLPLLLFCLAAQVRINSILSIETAEYWQWAGAILLVGVLYALFSAKLLANNMQQPMEQLQAAMSRVERGELDVQAPDLYSDEFSGLIAGFNHMVKGLRAREETNARLLESYYSTLAAALDARDTYTAGHSERVAKYSLIIGERAGLPSWQLDQLRRSALLHDIGKIGVRDAVLLKDGKLTDEEFAQIKLHPALGEAILKRIEPQEAMAPLLPGVRSHHERYDGRGYPDGLSGEEIPLFGRIIAVADAFDAMTSNRPYRLGMPVEKAISILSEGKGTQWDPYFTQLFIDAHHEDESIAKTAANS